MRYLALLLSFLSSVSLYAQVRSIYGRVLNKEGQGVQEAFIEGKSWEHIACDSQGYFSAKGNADTIKTRTFTIYAPGYEPKEIQGASLPADSIFIELQRETEDAYEVRLHEHAKPILPVIDESDSVITARRNKTVRLNEVTIQSTKRKVYERVLGKRKLKQKSGAYMENGDEVAIFLAADPDRKGILKCVYAYITAEGHPDAKFRKHVYARDSTMETPGIDIPDSVVIAHADKGDEWVSVDLGSKRIPVKDGIFISIEWLEGYGNNAETWHKEQLPAYRLALCRQNDACKEFNGQVLGMTWDYGTRSITHTSAHYKRDYWSHDRISLQRRGLVRVYHWANPMIYCTYTYAKK